MSGTTGAEPFVRLQQATKHYKDFTLGPITATIQPGYVTALLGPGGSGKTTLINLITGLVNTTTGTVHIGNHHVSPHTGSALGVAVVRGDSDSLLDDEEIPDLVRIRERYDPSFIVKTFREACVRWRVPVTGKIKDLSRGQRIGLQLALAAARDTRLLLLDEPTGGLSPQARAHLLDDLRDYVEDGSRAVVLSTHVTEDAESIADYVMVLHHGELVAHTDTPDFLGQYRRIAGPSVVGVPDADSLLGVRTTSTGYTAIATTTWAEHHARTLAETGHVVEPSTLREVVAAISRERKTA